MTRLQTLRRLASLTLAALLIGACGSPGTQPANPPFDPSPILPSGPGDQVPVITPLSTIVPADAGYPPPADQPTAPAGEPYPAPTPSGSSPGDMVQGSVSLALPGAPNTANVAGAGDGAVTPAFTGAFVVATYPHDPQAYTQGLVYIGDDTFYEGTGMYAASSLREVALTTGAVRRQVLLSTILGPDRNGNPAFGEGIAVVGERIFQLSWLNGRGVIYNRDFQPVGQFTYPPAGQAGPVEGWGLTYDPAAGRLIMSDGTATLYFVDPAETERTGVLAITGQVVVRDAAGTPVERLNELELVNGELLANIWQQDLIARIDPATGRVASYLDLSGLRALMPAQGPEVLNGIAYDAAGDRLFVTGKYWPSLFEIDLPVARAYLPLTVVAPPVAPPSQWS